MTTIYFKTAGGIVGMVRDVPATGGGFRMARAALRKMGYVEISEAEYARLKAEIDQREIDERKARGKS
jgi:hypothetical protein